MQRSIRFLPLIWVMALISGCAPAPAAAQPSPTGAPPAAQPGHATTTGSTVAASQPTAAANVPGVQVNVTLADHGITSSLTDFKAGVPYTFVIKNTGTRGICFDIAEPTSVTGSFGASQGGALLSIPESRLTVGSVVTTSYTFPESAAGVPLELSCLQRRAYDDKVRLVITVTK